MGRLGVLDAWRGVAALFVAMFHLQVIRPDLVPGAPFAGCAAFVDFFFVLSGFVLARGYFKPNFDAVSFTWRRIARLFPLHLYTLLVFLTLEAGKSLASAQGGVAFKRAAFEGLGGASFLDNLFLLQVTGVVWHRISWNTPAWSLSAELAVNVLVAVLAASVLRRVMTGVMAVVVAGCLAVLASHLMPISDYGPAALVRCLYAFGIGFLLFRLFEGKRPRLSWGVASGLEALALSMVAAAVSVLPVAYWYVSGGIFAFAVYIFAHEAGVVSAIVRRLRLDFLGTLSYSIYLNHIAVLFVAEKAFGLVFARGAQPGSTGAVVFCCVFLGSVIVYSWLTYRWIEQPGQRWLLGLGKRAAVGRRGELAAA